MVEVRQATLEDEQPLFELVRQFPTPTPVAKPDFANYFRLKLLDSAGYIGVAELDQRLIGYVSAYSHLAFYASGRTAWVDEILVQQEFRRDKVGTTLLQKVEQWAKGIGCILVSLATQRSGPFYLGLGYQTGPLYYKKYLVHEGLPTGR